MAFCPNCGTSVDGRFCAKCGASVAQDAGAPIGAPSSTPPISGSTSSGMSDNVAAALAYISIVGIIFLLIEPYNRNKTVRFHALQGLLLAATSIVTYIVMSVIASVFWGLLFLMPLVYLAFFGIFLFLMFKAYSGEKIVLPVIGPIAEKQA
jgi:uncharacterized membrane protein